jgi:hypothetical protein
MDLSASTMRKALAEDDLEMVKLHLPDDRLLKSVLHILDYVPSQKKTMMENLTLKDLFSLVENTMTEKEKKKKKKNNKDLPLTFDNNNEPALDISKHSTKTRNTLNEQPGGMMGQPQLMPLEQVIPTIQEQIRWKEKK